MKTTRAKELSLNSRTTSNKCTDIRWLLLFIAFWMFLVIIGVFAVIYGNYIALIKGYDSFGNLCGVKNNQPFKNFTLSGTDTSAKSYLFYFGYGNLSNVVTICVENCNKDVVLWVTNLHELYKHNKTSLCRYDFNYSLIESDPLPRDLGNRRGPCPNLFVAESIPLKRRCVPLDINYIYSSNTYGQINLGASTLQVLFSYIYLWRAYIFALGFLALYIAGVLLCIIRLQERVRPCLMGFVCFVTTLSLCGEIYYIHLHFPNEIFDYLHDWYWEKRGMLYTFMEDFQLNKSLLYGFLTCGLLTTEVLLVVLILARKCIDSASILMKEAVKCCKDTPQLVYFSLMSSIVLGAVYSLFTYVIMCSSAASERRVAPFALKETEMGDEQHSHLRQLEKVVFAPIKAIQSSSFVHVFGLIWTARFIVACEQFCLETLATQWYWRTESTSPMYSIVWTLVTQHLGSAARRSFVGMFTIPRLILTTICQWLRECCSPSNRLGQKLESFESTLRSLLPDVYAFRAAGPTQHCRSGPVETLILGANKEVLEGIRCVIYTTLLTAKVTVVHATGLVAIFLMDGQDDSYLYMAPVIWTSILAFCIAHVIVSVIETPMATILFCIIESQQGIHNGGRESERNALEPDIIQVGN